MERGIRARCRRNKINKYAPISIYSNVCPVSAGRRRKDTKQILSRRLDVCKRRTNKFHGDMVDSSCICLSLISIMKQNKVIIMLKTELTGYSLYIPYTL